MHYFTAFTLTPLVEKQYLEKVDHKENRSMYANSLRRLEKGHVEIQGELCPHKTWTLADCFFFLPVKSNSQSNDYY